jgi:hypothetical protein
MKYMYYRWLSCLDGLYTIGRSHHIYIPADAASSISLHVLWICRSLVTDNPGETDRLSVDGAMTEDTIDQ